MRRLFLIIFLLITIEAKAGLVTMRYWFDQNYALCDSVVCDTGQWHYLLDVSSLSDGMHTLNMQLGNGATAELHSYVFYKTSQSDSAVFSLHYDCWFDQNYDARQSGTIGTGNFLIDVNSLREGMHTLNMQLGNGASAELRSYIFYKMPQVGSTAFSLHYDCWFDQDYDARQSGTIGTGNFLIDVNSLRDGMHTLNMQIGEGNLAELRSYVFYKMYPREMLADTSLLRYYYAIDGSQREPMEVHPNSGLIHIDLDVNNISTGLHTLNCFMMTDDGSSSSLYSTFFYKTPAGGLGLNRYEYCFNGEYNNFHTVDVPIQDTLQIITLLPLDSLPIRSMCFEFNPNNGSPIIYAKNDITFRFWNAEQRFTEATRQYVDERVMQVVVADTLERDTTKVIPVPNNNAIHWFKLAAGTGDSLSFHTNRRCTMQLYAPSGEMVFHTSGDTVLTWRGCHAWENGVYYLAVHDAEGTGNIAVSYQWIYRYAVLACTPNRIGNLIGREFELTLVGNGFNELQTLSFVLGSDTLKADSLVVELNNKVYAYCTITDSIPNGYYQAIAIFSDSASNDTITRNGLLKIEEPAEGYPLISFNCPSYMARPFPVDVTITNTGNLAQYMLPLNFAFTTPENIESIDFGNFCVIDSEGADTTSYSFAVATTDLFGMGIEGCMVFSFMPILNAYESITYSLLITAPANAMFDMYAWTSYDTLFAPYRVQVDTIEEENETLMQLLTPSSNRFLTEDDDFLLKATDEQIARAHNMLTIGNCIETVGNNEHIRWPRWMPRATTVANNTIKTGITIAGIHHALEYNSVRARVEAYGLEGTDLGDELMEAVRRPLVSPREIWNRDCDLADLVQQQYNCSEQNTPNPGNPYHVHIVVPGDPNDIAGYISESGSRMVGAAVETLGYNIEFENDSALASSSAHVVVVRDTLDSSVFDLNSLSATSFIIGDVVTNVGGQSFTRTMDMRPEIDVLAQVQLDYHVDSAYAVATWTFSSLDPMTLQPTVADTLGFLSIGGTGEVNFTINRKANLPDSTIIDNRAWITFDNEEPIATSTWRNIIDATPPVSNIDSVTYIGDTAIVAVSATDNFSGVWKYHVYAQLGDDVLLPVAMNVVADTVAILVPPTGTVMLHSAAVDSAGNMESIIPIHPVWYDTLYVTACDSFAWNNSTYTISGEYVRMRSSAHPGGYDTVTTLYLTVNHSTAGDTTAVVCDSYTWHGLTYTASGTPTYQTTNAAGCDSTVTLNLTIRQSSTGTETQDICDSYTWHGVTYTASTNTPTFVEQNAAGCDSTVTLNLTIRHSSTGIETQDVCDAFVWHGTTYTSGGNNVATYTTTNDVGCDSVVTLNLTLRHSNSYTDIQTACDSYIWHETTYTASTSTPTFTSLNAAGCDSTVSLQLTVNYSSSGTDVQNVCDSYTWHGTTYTLSTNTPTFIEQNAAGCDSTVTLNLTIRHSSSSTNALTVCDSYTWNGTTYTASEVLTHQTTNAAGCDSTATLNLAINYSTTGTDVQSACDSYTWHGTTYTVSNNTATFETTNTAGCDSTVTLNLTVNYSTTGTDVQSACDSYTWIDGVNYTTSNYIATFNTTNIAGCDSVVTLNLTINYSSTGVDIRTACDEFTWIDGATYTTGGDGIAIYTTTNAAGCDSTVTLNLTINHGVMVYDSLNLISNEIPYDYHGNTINGAGNYTFEGTTEQGCDSITLLHVEVTTVGVDAADPLAGLKVYPNPTRGTLTIEADDVVSVEVFDMAGRLVVTFEGVNSFDITELAAGTYMLRIKMTRGETVRRIVKK